MLDFSQILYQQCNVYLQIKCQISVKSVNASNSYSRFSEVTQKRSVRYRQPDRCDCQSVRLCKYQTYLVCVQNVLHVLECKLEKVDAMHCLTASLMNRCWKCSHSWSSATLAGQRHDPAAVYKFLQLTPNLAYRVEVRTFSWPQSWSDEVRC